MKRFDALEEALTYLVARAPISGNIKVMKGVFDKNTSVQFSPEYWRVIDSIRSAAKRGDSKINELVGKSIADKTTVAQLDVDKVSMKLINDILENHY